MDNKQRQAEVIKIVSYVLGSKEGFEEFMLMLSNKRFINKHPHKHAMFEVHNSFLGKSDYIKRFEEKNSRCGSCIRRVQTNLLKHFKSAIWKEDSSSLELRMIDNQDGRPIFRVKAKEAEVVSDTANGEDASKLQEESSTPKQPPKKRGRRKKSTSTKKEE